MKNYGGLSSFSKIYDDLYYFPKLDFKLRKINAELKFMEKERKLEFEPPEALLVEDGGTRFLSIFEAE